VAIAMVITALDSRKVGAETNVISGRFESLEAVQIQENAA